MDSKNLHTDQTLLMQRYHGQLYRLALLVSGDVTAAAERTNRAFDTVAQHSDDAEMALARALIETQGQLGRRQRWTWRADTAALERGGLGREQAERLLRLLAERTAHERLLLGLHLLWGLPHAQAATWAGTSPGALAELEAAAAVALGAVPPDGDRALLLQIAGLLDGTLEEEQALAVRGRLLADDSARELRDGLLRARKMMQQSFPPLFAAVPPPPKAAVARDAQTRVLLGTLRISPRLALVGAVLLIIGVLLAVPAVRQQVRSSSESRAAGVVRDPAALIEAAIRRYEQVPVGGGVLHEIYRGELEGEVWRLERWYDYSVPNRLRVTVRRDGSDELRYGLASDGEGRVQYRIRQERYPNSSLLSTDLDLPPDELREVFPILRQQPDLSFFNENSAPDLARAYLAQARAAKLTALGSSRYAGRAVQLVSYNTDQPWPRARGKQPEPMPSQVLLSFDTATAALLDVAVLPEGEGIAAAQHPWRTELFELVPSATAETFTLPDATGEQRQMLPNPRSPAFFFTNGAVSLQEAMERSLHPLYVPQQLPEAQMRSLALNTDSFRQSPLLMYEGEFRSLAIVPGHEGLPQTDLSVERQAGAFSYRVAAAPFNTSMPLSTAYVTLPGDDEQYFQVYLLDQYATAAERDALLEQTIASLMLVTAENVEVLGRSFYQPDAAGGAAR